MFARNRRYDRARLLAEATRARQKGKAQKAVALYREILGAEPGNVDVHRRLAPLLARTRRHEEAWTSYRRAAEGLEQQGFVERAIGVYREAAHHMPRESAAWLLPVRETAAARRAFREVLGGRTRVFETITAMHRIGILRVLLPEFAHLECLVSHDPFHVYTVDHHSLVGVREIETLRSGALLESLPLLTGVARELAGIDLLVLSMLCHDIGKGRGGEHSQRGSLLMDEVSRRLGLNEDEAATCKFLVANHLYMSHLAQRRDIGDDALVADFFKIVRESLAARELLSAACGQAYVMLTLAKAIEGREALETAAIPAKRDITLDIIIRNVWGTKIPDVAVTEIRRPLLERAANPVATSARTIESSANFEEVIAAIFAVAATEIKLRKIGEEIKKTTRRVNAELRDAPVATRAASGSSRIRRRCRIRRVRM